MIAAVLSAFGDADQLCVTDLPKPEPQTDEVLLRVLACGVNRGLDARTRANAAGRNLPLPLVLGTEIVGEVAVCGPGVTGWTPGDRVLVEPWIACGQCRPCLNGHENACQARVLFGLNRPGGNAEYVLAPARSLLALPATDRPLEEAAALPVSYVTAHHMICARARLMPDETIVVLGAAGPVGRAAIEIAHLQGARVVAVVSSPAKAQSLPEGATEVIVGSPGFADRVLDLTAGHGADVVIDHVGARTIGESLRALAPNGRAVVCGASSGHDLQIDARPLWRKCASILFSNTGTREDLTAVLKLWGEGRFAPMPLTLMSLDQISAAHRTVEDREFIGKVVITP